MNPLCKMNKTVSKWQVNGAMLHAKWPLPFVENAKKKRPFYWYSNHQPKEENENLTYNIWLRAFETESKSRYV